MIDKKLNRRQISVLALSGISSLGLGLPALGNAQGNAFPSRPIKFVVPFPPGSGTDTTARMFAKKVGELAGQPITVENKPGGNGFIGVQAVLNAPADGYTVFLGSNSTLSTNAATFKKLPYDPIADFAPITVLSRGPCLIVVPPNSPYKTLNDLIAAAKKRPGALNYASGSVSYTLYTEWLNELAKIKTTAFNYKGAGDAINGTMAGTVDFSVVDASGAIELVKGGRLHALAYTAPERSPLLPDVPTSAEAGMPGYLAYNWVAAAVPAKTPPETVKRLGELFEQAGASAEIKDHYLRQSTTLLMTGGAEMRKYQIDEIARWKRLAATAGLELL